MPKLLLLTEEYVQRQNRLRAQMADLGVAGAVVFHPVRVAYLTGFAFYPTERPIVLILPVEAEATMLVPALEEQHLLSQVPRMKAHVYAEYPGREHPMIQLGKLLKSIGRGTDNWGADCDGYIDLNGYQGPPLSAVVAGKVTPISNTIDHMRMVKSASEVQILREAGRLAASAHRLLHERIAAGAIERDICRQTEEQALAEAAALSEGDTWGFLSVIATILAGPRTGMPHAATGMRHIEAGDGVVTICEAIAGGYHVELERTLFVGPPTDSQRRFYEVAHRAQELTMALLRPGTPCAEVDAKVSEWFAAQGCSEFALHHQGHGLGLEGHERPFLDIGDATVLEAGMVLSIEPGLYVPRFGGFRNSDTVVVRERGAESLTPYPARIEELIV